MTEAYRLRKPWKYLYTSLRILLWGVFLISMSTFVFSILFPSRDLSYTFSDSRAGGNEIERPRTETGDSRENGYIREGDTLVLDASVLGDFSHARVIISGQDALDAKAIQCVTARRSQQAFFYPKGPPAVFPTGTLLRYKDSFFLVGQDEMKHRFPSEEYMRSLGYDVASFMPVSDEEFAANPEGLAIPETQDRETPPNSAFVQASATYYLWKDGKLFPFVSEGAFLEQFPKSWALVRDDAFIKNHTVSDEWIGYPSGSLLAWGDGVYIMDHDSPRPVLGADIFLSLGYSWDDVRPVSDEEISLVQKGKFIDTSVPHPNGTVLLDTKENRYFLVQDETLREIRGASLLHLWLGKKHPISVSSETFERDASCTPHDASMFSADTIECLIPLENLANLSGDTYEVSFSFVKKTTLDRMDIIFESSLKEQTLLATFSKLKSRILSRYLPSS